VIFKKKKVEKSVQISLIGEISGSFYVICGIAVGEAFVNSQ
jgi:hypothetical protein